MFLVFGQFLNQTTGQWQWQQVGGVPFDEQEADQYAYGFARDYRMVCKVVGRHGTKMYLPPVDATVFVDTDPPMDFPEIKPEMIQTQ